MKNWIKKQIKNTFGLVEYERIEEAYSRYLRSSQAWQSDRAELVLANAALAESNARMVKHCEDLNGRLMDCALRLALAEVAPVESFSKAMDKLYAVREALASDGRFDVTEIDLALMELEGGYRTAKEAKAGANNAHR